jgi:hypothetical protein
MDSVSERRRIGGLLAPAAARVAERPGTRGGGALAFHTTWAARRNWQPPRQSAAGRLRVSIRRSPARVRYDAMPSGREASTSGRTLMRRPNVLTSMMG